MKSAIILLSLLPLAWGQDGRLLMAQLKGDPASDAQVFREVGPDLAQQLLLAVMNRGLAKTATLDDWADMHRSFDGLMALEIYRKNPAKAAAWAFFNENYYRVDEKNYEAALACARKGLELDLEAGQPSYLMHKSIAEDLRRLGRAQEAMAAFHEAENTLTDTLDRTAGVVRREMVETLLDQGKRDEAGQLTEEMMQRATKAPPLYQAMSLLTQSDLLFADGKYADGVEVVRNALALTAGTPDAAAGALEAASQLTTAVVDGLRTLSYEDALALARLVDKEIAGLPFQVAPYVEIAIRQRRRMSGDLDSVLREDTARVEAARGSGDLQQLSQSLESLATSYTFVNGMRQRAVALEEAAEAGPSYGVLNGLGETYIELGQPGPARRAFDRVLKAYASTTDAASQQSLRSYREEAVMGMAGALVLDGDPDGARSMLKNLLANVSADTRPYLLLQIGKLERNLNEKPSAAVDAYEKAIDGLHASLDYSQELSARLTLIRYLAIRAQDRVPEARAKAVAQLAASETLAHGMQYADSEWRLDYLNGVLAEAEDLKLAIARYRQALLRLDNLRSGLSQQEQRQSFLDNESVEDLYARLITLLTRAGLKDDAWQYMERAKARGFLEALQGRRFAADVASPHGAELAELDTLEKKMADLRVQLSPGNVKMLRDAGREPATLELALKDLEARFTEARSEASLSQSRGGQVLALRPPALSAIQKSLGTHTVLLEYALLNGEITAFVVTPSSADQVSWKADTTKLRRDALQLRGLLADAQSTEWPALLDEVSKTLMTPVAARIPAGTRQILVVPAGYLNYLPFPVLSLPNGHALVDDYAVSALPSASALLYLGPGTHNAGEVFLGALGTVAVDGLPPLPGTLTETAGIAAAYPKAMRASGEAFTHDAAQHALLSADTVHFATHGLLEEEAPLFSALVTSPAAGQPSRLSLYEIVGMKLRARLVVLSACETGLGKLQGGDEITGLTRTFLTAGADTVVASLWKVSDESTAMLMKEFYRQLGEGVTPAEALRASALAVRAKYPHPFYWAAFVVTGRN